jgi:hypothetical protein
MITQTPQERAWFFSPQTPREFIVQANAALNSFGSEASSINLVSRGFEKRGTLAD